MQSEKHGVGHVSLKEDILFSSTSTGPLQLLGGVYHTIRNESAQHSYSHIVQKEKRKKEKSFKKTTQQDSSQTQGPAPMAGPSNSFRSFRYRLFTAYSYPTRANRKGK